MLTCYYGSFAGHKIYVCFCCSCTCLANVVRHSFLLSTPPFSDGILDAEASTIPAYRKSGQEWRYHASVKILPFLLQVPYWQSRIVQGCRKRGKPVIVATNMLESMITNPTPTRAEVSDIAIAVREGTDAVMLSGETAYGKFPYKSVSVMATVAKRTENAMLTYQVRAFVQ